MMAGEPASQVNSLSNWIRARQLAPKDGLTIRHAAWYTKDSPTVSDTIDRLTETVCYAA